MSEPDQRMLLHDVADRLNGVSDCLPLPDQLGPHPAVGEVLDDEVRNLARLLTFLSGETAFRHRATARSLRRPQTPNRRVALALARAAQPTGAALAALGDAVHRLGVLIDLTHHAAGPGHAQATEVARQALVDSVASARGHLAHAARQLRTTADAPTASAAAALPAPSPASSRTR
ncbi:hypothetical protein ABZ725_31840 [Streptomyces sp. NPDC006872]|uniref:hypothetical protein n=1 Tax=Streptomyces sp. NPDC006872 TaxID=3155720 RepID=UPI0033F97D47